MYETKTIATWVLSCHWTLHASAVTYWNITHIAINNVWNRYVFCQEVAAITRKMMIPTTLLAILLQITVTHGVGQTFLKMAHGRNCTLIMTCNFHQIRMRSKTACVLVAVFMMAKGSYYSSSTKMCNLCFYDSTETPTFEAINSDVHYYALGKGCSQKRTHEINVTFLLTAYFWAVGPIRVAF